MTQLLPIYLLILSLFVVRILSLDFSDVQKRLDEKEYGNSKESVDHQSTEVDEDDDESESDINDSTESLDEPSTLTSSSILKPGFLLPAEYLLY